MAQYSRPTLPAAARAFLGPGRAWLLGLVLLLGLLLPPAADARPAVVQRAAAAADEPRRHWLTPAAATELLTTAAPRPVPLPLLPAGLAGVLPAPPTLLWRPAGHPPRPQGVRGRLDAARLISEVPNGP